MTTTEPFEPPLPSPEIETTRLFTPRFDADGLIPAVVTDHATGEALMFAWMNADALHKTLLTGTAHFWSRSRGKLWLKGEESGNVLSVMELRTDCDQDVIWVRATVGGAGKACHTGARTCFYRIVTTASSGGNLTIALVPDAGACPGS